MKTTIVMITGTYQLLQALWYASAYPENEYIAIIKNAEANAQVRQEIRELCERSSIFSRVLEYEGTTIDSSGLQKAVLMMKMVLAFITGRREKLTGKMIRQQMGGLEYDSVIVDSELSILGGAFIDHSDHIDTVIMQEGLSDALERSKTLRKGRGELVGYLLAKMGYCSPSIVYPLKKAAYCRKMTSMESLLKYRDYAGFIPLFSDVSPKRYQEILQRTYPLDIASVNEADVILFTNPLDKFSAGDEEYEKMHRWMTEHCTGKQIKIKKHPRDSYAYDWPDLSIQFIDSNIPAELVLSQVSPDTELLFMFISTCILDILTRDIDYRIFYFSGIGDIIYRSKFEEIQDQLKIEEKYVEKL